MPHDITDPITIASVIVRDHLDTVISRHTALQKADDQNVPAEAETAAVSVIVVKLANALLQHLPGEVKRVRADAE